MSTVRHPGKIKKRTKIYVAYLLSAIPTFTYFTFRWFPEPNAVWLFSNLQEIPLTTTYSGFQTCIHLNLFASSSLSPLWDAQYQGCYLVRQCCAREQVMQAYELRIYLPRVMNFNALEVFKTCLEQQQAALESEIATVKKDSPRECKWSDVPLHPCFAVCPVRPVPFLHLLQALAGQPVSIQHYCVSEL